MAVEIVVVRSRGRHGSVMCALRSALLALLAWLTAVGLVRALD